jgi:hypothetical protein
MGEPEWNQLRLEPKSLCLGVRDAGEMLEANKRSASPVDDQLSRVRRANSHHEDDVDVGVVLEQSTALFFGGSGECDHVCALEHGAQIGSIRQRGELHYVSKVGTVGIEDVVVPVRFKKTPVCFEVAVVGCDAISAIEDGKEVR